MARSDVIPDSVARIALDNFQHSESAQIGTTPSKHIDDARNSGNELENAFPRFCELSHGIDGDT